MGRYTDNYCAVCFRELIRPQNTCGAPECLLEWRHWNAERRLMRKNLAHMPPSERALILAQGPSESELRAHAEAQTQLEHEVEAHGQAEERKKAPDFIRNMLDPTNAPIKETP